MARPADEADITRSVDLVVAMGHSLSLYYLTYSMRNLQKDKIRAGDGRASADGRSALASLARFTHSSTIELLSMEGIVVGHGI